jgi:sodium-dependent dicarboxylate transporter 2/3/5
VATLIGTPPNAIFVGLLERLYGLQVGFTDWMKLGVPVSASMLLLCWFLLTRVLYPLGSAGTQSEAARDHIRAELRQMGSITTEESRVAGIFALVALAWILRGLFDLPALSMVADSAIAIAGAVLLFAIPAGRLTGGHLLDWKTAAMIPWDIIILMGGGFALAEGFSSTGLTEWLAGQLGVLHGVPPFLLVLAVVLVVTFLTEMTSNAATATLFIPVMGALAVSMDLHPLALMVPSALAASLAFMLPVATPPNAIVFGSRQLTIGQMVKAGIWLNLIGALVVSVLCTLFVNVLL